MVTIYNEIRRLPVEEHKKRIFYMFQWVDACGLSSEEVITYINAHYPHLHRRYISNKDWGLLRYFLNRKWIIRKRGFSGRYTYFSGLSTPPFYPLERSVNQ